MIEPGLRCEMCQREVEEDGWCARSGKYNPAAIDQGGSWLCDDCVFETRWQAASGAPPRRPPMSKKEVQQALGSVDIAAQNLTIFEGFSARDPSGACRDIPYLHLTYREARPILDTMKKVLEEKLVAMG